MIETSVSVARAALPDGDASLQPREPLLLNVSFPFRHAIARIVHFDGLSTFNELLPE